MGGKRFGLDKANILSRHLFGIQARLAEPFGISVAEMIKAGCITFVPNEGGQAEITDHPLLMYGSVDEAVDKIDTVLRKPKLQNELRDHLEIQGARLSANAFMNGIKAAVGSMLKRTQK